MSWIMSTTIGTPIFFTYFWLRRSHLFYIKFTNYNSISIGILNNISGNFMLVIFELIRWFSFHPTKVVMQSFPFSAVLLTMVSSGLDLLNFRFPVLIWSSINQFNELTIRINHSLFDCTNINSKITIIITMLYCRYFICNRNVKVIVFLINTNLNNISSRTKHSFFKQSSRKFKYQRYSRWMLMRETNENLVYIRILYFLFMDSSIHRLAYKNITFSIRDLKSWLIIDHRSEILLAFESRRSSFDILILS